MLLKSQIVLLPLLLFLVGCPKLTVDVPKPVLDATAQATQNVRQGLDSLGEGLKGLDPAGINRLLNENGDLRAKLESVTKSLNAAAGLGMIEIANRTVQLRVATYTGAFSVTAWVDNPDNKFWLNRTMSLKTFSFGNESANIGEIHTRSVRSCPPGSPTCNGDSWDNMAKAALAWQKERITSYLSANTIVPGPDFESIDLNTSFGGVSGLHKIYFQVTPIEKDDSGKWSIRFQTILMTANGNSETVREFDITSDQSNGAALNVALPVVEQSLLVKIGG